MATKAIRRQAAAERCELCGAGTSDSVRDRFGHLRTEHPAYTWGLVLRMAAPLAFLAIVVALQALQAPTSTLLVAIGASAGLAIAGVAISRSARMESGAPAGAPLGRLLREGGLRFVILAGILALMLVLASTR